MTDVITFSVDPGVKLIGGPMFSGKTSELIRRITCFTRSGISTVVLKPTKDTRYSRSKVITHEDMHGNRMSIDAFSVESLSQAEELDNFDDVSVVGIDEGNFFGDDIAYFCDKWRRGGKLVIVTGLNGSFKREHFGFFHKLYPICKEYTLLSAICTRCKCEAHFTHRKGHNEAELVVGGAELYEPMCGPCFDLATN